MMLFQEYEVNEESIFQAIKKHQTNLNRKKYPARLKKAIVKYVTDNKLNIKVFCVQNQIAKSSFHKWKKAFKPILKTPTPTPTPTPTQKEEIKIKFKMNGIEIECFKKDLHLFIG